MKNVRHVLPAVICVIAIGLVTQASYGGISGSAHDFGQFGWAKNQICLPCHTPHNAIVRDAQNNIVGGPLWSHTLTAVTSYTLYLDWQTGTTVSGAVDTNSRLCLSCHDGTVAVDSFFGGAGTQQLTGGLIGTDLSNDHPIGEAAIWWTTTPGYMVDPSLRAAAGIMPLRRMADGRMAVGCTSCHEPHNRRNTTGMLWVANNVPGTTVDGRAVSGSLLCMNCHKK